jgi:ATP-dependent exoDNAse (exonuclease V) alpha subunit
MTTNRTLSRAVRARASHAHGLSGLRGQPFISALLDALTGLVERAGAKLVAVGDGKQLPSIGPGGMFDRLADHAPTAELADIHRTKDPADQRAWQALRAGEPERAMAHYASRGRLHLSDTRDQAAEHAVQTWAALTDGRDIREVALIADAANTEIDRLNARAQHLRAQRGELGHHEIPLPGVYYGLREGDLIAFTTQHRPRGQPRVENGTRGQVSTIHEQGVTITLDGSQRKIQLARENLDSLRLAYAQHVYRQQGATVQRSIVLTGGWQTSKETAYVEATRARHGTDWFIARNQLGTEGQDAARITCLAQQMCNSRRDLRAVVLEQAAGEMAPDEALGVAREMIRDRRVLTLEGGRMTTLAVRAQEQAIERRATQLAQPVGRDVGEIARGHAVREVAECIAGPLSPEQHHALEVLTGPERAAVLIGAAGTGKGVVIDAAARAEQHAGRETIGVAVSGSTAERLGADSPALAGRTLTLDALVARANTGTMQVGHDTTVILDEAGMVDHKRLDALTGLVERSGAKLIAVGDGKQLPSIGPGGMFDRLADHAPTAVLADIHRTEDPAERRAWQALRAGEPERAMAHYASRGQLHLSDTRDQAAEHAVQTWAALTEGRDIREVALIADAANTEIDRLNARAQHLRAERGELGHHEIALPGVHYGLREGDLIAFTTQHRPRGQPRVENGTRGQISTIYEQGVTLTLDGSQRKIQLARVNLDSLRLAYAQHVYRQQGATVERSVVLTGGWQTSKETAYVEATRARHGTDWFIARDDLGNEGQDSQRIQRLAQNMHRSHAQTPSLAHPELPDPEWGSGFRIPIAPIRRSRIPGITRTINHIAQPDRTPERTR